MHCLVATSNFFPGEQVRGVEWPLHCIFPQSTRSDAVGRHTLYVVHVPGTPTHSNTLHRSLSVSEKRRSAGGEEGQAAQGAEAGVRAEGGGAKRE